MTDARLLATNPENSSLVPVACNAQGQLIVADVQIEGIDNDVTVDGDLTVTGGVEFIGSVDIGGNKGASTGLGHWIQPNGEHWQFIDNSSAYKAYQLFNGLNNEVASIGKTGSASFAGDINVGAAVSSARLAVSAPYNQLGLYVAASGASYANIAEFCDSSGDLKASISASGSATLADGKAGFTPEGNLWCTTVRGDTVILDATANGLGSWQPYTPATRRDVLKEAWAEKDKVDQGFGVSPEDGDET